jgi:hypothetical protein
MARKKKEKEPVIENTDLQEEIIQTEEKNDNIVEPTIEENATSEQPEPPINNEPLSEVETLENAQTEETLNEESNGTTNSEPTKKQRKLRTPKEKKPLESDNISNDEFAQLEEEMSKANSINTNVAPTKQRKSKPVEGLITGYIVLYVCDIVFPVGIAWVSKSMFHSEIPSKALKLTSEQWKRLEPIADEAVKGLIVTIQPQWALVILLGLSYFENAVSFVPKIEKNVINNKRRKAKGRKNNESKGNS